MRYETKGGLIEGELGVEGNCGHAGRLKESRTGVEGVPRSHTNQRLIELGRLNLKAVEFLEISCNLSLAAFLLVVKECAEVGTV